MGVEFREHKWKTVVFTRSQLEFGRRDIPKERFVKYEPSDLAWLIPLGMAPLTTNAERRLLGYLMLGE